MKLTCRSGGVRFRFRCVPPSPGAVLSETGLFMCCFNLIL